MATIILSGALANKPHNGGEAWVRLNWWLGLKRLGHRVTFVEQLDPPPAPAQEEHGHHDALGRQIRYFANVVKRFGLQDEAALVDGAGGQLWGLRSSALNSAFAAADALINISGNLRCECLADRISRRVYVDLDPGFTQFWQEQGVAPGRLEAHDFHFTVGTNIGSADCPIPTNGLHWRPVLQPVVLEEWPVAESTGLAGFTTIGSWRGSFGPVRVSDRTYGQKVHEHRKFIQLPRLVNHRFEMALDIHTADHADMEQLGRHGWRLVDPQLAAADPDRFRRYVQRSTAEFSVAQEMYVATNSGWFSDRTVRYLASGKPALVQETAFSRRVPTGEGLLAFSDMAEAVAGVKEIARDYDHHCAEARRLAKRYFDSDRVLGEFLETVGVESAARPDLLVSQAR
jgi:hypothetical protein